MDSIRDFLTLVSNKEQYKAFIKKLFFFIEKLTLNNHIFLSKLSIQPALVLQKLGEFFDKKDEEEDKESKDLNTEDNNNIENDNNIEDNNNTEDNNNAEESPRPLI
jgi:hypothetical protein